MGNNLEKASEESIVDAVDSSLKNIVSTLDLALARNQQRFEELYRKAPRLFYVVDKKPSHSYQASEAVT